MHAGAAGQLGVRVVLQLLDAGIKVAAGTALPFNPSCTPRMHPSPCHIKEWHHQKCPSFLRHDDDFPYTRTPVPAPSYFASDDAGLLDIT